MMTLGQAHALLPGATLVGDPGLRIERVHGDTRTVHAGDLYVALRGERFDGHAFLPQARAAGAVAALAEHGIAEAGLAGLQVADSLRGLQTLARGWRAALALPLVAVTGSNGKTTVTQMIGAILRAWLGDAALATAGNFNNHIGVPLTLLRLRPSTRAAVVELGMNHAGEIAELAALAAPTVALINNAQREHQEFLDGVEAVAVENGAVIDALPADGTLVVPADDAFTPLWCERAGPRRVLRFGPGDGADVHADAHWNGSQWSLGLHTPRGDIGTALQAPGQHNVHNALAAAACALAVGAPPVAIATGLRDFRPVKGRSATQQLRWRGHALTLVDDSYNANPDSVRAAIEVLAALPPPHWLVLGDMGEVGHEGPTFHAEVGRHAREHGIEHLWCAGALAAHTAQAYGPAARHFTDAPALAAALAQAPEVGSVLVKGSRFMAMERVVQALQREASHAA